MTSHEIKTCDCLLELQKMPENSVDLVFTSPPYEAARTYGIDFDKRGEDWVTWAFVRYVECVRVTRGLVAWVVEGQTRQFSYSATPILLAADLKRSGVKLRKPPAFHRVGIPGSGGPDWLRNDYEFVICSSKGRLPWSDNTAMGHTPKYAPGGEMSYRNQDGRRKNARDAKENRAERRNVWGRSNSTRTNVDKEVGFYSTKRTPSQGQRTNGVSGNPGYEPPKKANPGNVIHCKVGGGHMGSPLASENEAPFPESLVEFFIRSFCPPGGKVLDPFCGSGTVAKVAKKFGRNSISFDCRASQTALTKRRIKEVIE